MVSPGCSAKNPISKQEEHHAQARWYGKGGGMERGVDQRSGLFEGDRDGGVAAVFRSGDGNFGHPTINVYTGTQRPTIGKWNFGHPTINVYTGTQRPTIGATHSAEPAFRDSPGPAHETKYLGRPPRPVDTPHGSACMVVRTIVLLLATGRNCDSWSEEQTGKDRRVS